MGAEDGGRGEDGERTELWWLLGEQDKAGLGSWKMQGLARGFLVGKVLENICVWHCL